MKSPTICTEFEKNLLSSNLTIRHSALDKSEDELKGNVYLIVPQNNDKHNLDHSNSSNTKESNNNSDIINEGNKEQSMEELSVKINQLKEEKRFDNLEDGEINVDPNASWSDPEEDLDYLDVEMIDNSDDTNLQNTESEEGKERPKYSQTPNEESRQKKLFIQPKISIIPDLLANDSDEGTPCKLVNAILSRSFDGSTSFLLNVDVKKLLEVPRSVNYLKPSSNPIFLIKDKTNGRVYDIRNNLSVQSLNESELTRLSGGEPWDEWWKKKRNNMNKFFNAAEKGDIETVEDLLDRSKYGEYVVDIDMKGLNDFTPLHYAAYEGHLEMVKYLIIKGADVNALTFAFRTPLHLACDKGIFEMIQVLVEAGSDINVQDVDKNTPAHILSSCGYIEPLTWLLAKKPDLSLKNSYGETAVETATILEVRLIFAEGAKLSVANNYSRTVMNGLLLHNNRADVIKELIFQAQLISTQSISHTISPRVVERIPSCKSSSRVVKILEIAKKLKEQPIENQEMNNNSHIKPLTYINTSVQEEKKVQEDSKDVVTTDDFEAIALLGQGSFGSVYLVRYKKNNKLYAMKVLSKRSLVSQNMANCTRTERGVLSISKHPFIVGLHFAMQNSEKLFMVMEYCSGGDLAEVIKKEKRITEDRARIYVAEVILALEYLHKKNIIFRDLKAENVVLDDNGHALLTDFGLSKEGIMDNISANSFCGSLAYLAPEVLRRSGYGKAVDWYLLVTLLYELVIGYPPYMASTKEQLFKNIQIGSLALPKFLSKEIKSLIIGLLNRNPNKRLGSGKLGAEEIKMHSWFKGINWKEVIERKLKPPKPRKKQIRKPIVALDVFGDADNETNKIPKWDYKTTDKLL
jgi:serine/threonine protein kinase